MTERPPSTFVTQSLVLLVTLILGLALGGVIGYLLGQTLCEPCNVTSMPLESATSTPLLASSTESAIPTVSAIAVLTEPAPMTPLVVTTPSSGINDVAGSVTQNPTSPINSTVATSAIPLPEVVTLTPTPQATTVIEINDADASLMIRQQIATTPQLRFLENATITFEDQKLTLRAVSNDPTGQFGQGELVIRGYPEILGVRVIFRLESAQVEGQPVSPTLDPIIEALMNNMFQEMIGNRPAYAVEVRPGMLRLTLVELAKSYTTWF